MREATKLSRVPRGPRRRRRGSVSMSFYCAVLFFFFQAEDGIRDRNVTGVQTCALPISETRRVGRVVGRSRHVGFRQAGCPVRSSECRQVGSRGDGGEVGGALCLVGGGARSEERRVGRGGGAGWSSQLGNEKQSGSS